MIVRSVARRSYVYSARRYARGRCRSAAALAARRGLRFEHGNAVPDVLPSNRVRLLPSPPCLVGRDRRLALAAWICSALRRWNRASSTARPARALRHLSDADGLALGEQLPQLLLGDCARGTWEGTGERGGSPEGKVSELVRKGAKASLISGTFALVPRSPVPRSPGSLVFSRAYAGRYAFWNRITHP